MSFIETLRERGFVHDITEGLDKALEAGPIAFYCGFDPTADSLHVGTLLPMLLMRRLAKAGHKPICLIGTATGMIGDPSGKSKERQLLDKSLIEQNAKAISRQLEAVVGGEIAYNHSWLEKLSFIDFLRDVGKFVSVNSMIAKDSVSTRLNEREQGISYTEFSYMLLQAYDYYWLHKSHNCQLQIGGSDQWGNITAGLQLVKRFSESAEVFGLTSPLLTTSSGTKFGKTEEGTVWLSADKTSAYAFYQYWLNTQDSDVIRFLKLFTELTLEEISALEAETSEAPEKRAAQKALAESVTSLIHSPEGVRSAEQASQVLFGGSLEGISAKSLMDIFSDVPSTTINPGTLSEGLQIGDLWVSCKLANSKSAARRLIEGGGCYLNNKRIENFNSPIETSEFVDGSVLILRSGKKTYHLVRLGQ